MKLLVVEQMRGARLQASAEHRVLLVRGVSAGQTDRGRAAHRYLRRPVHGHLDAQVQFRREVLQKMTDNDAALV